MIALVRTVNLSLGSHVLIQDVSWEEYEALLEELGEDRLIPRLNYCHGILELMSPLPAHERPNRIITDIVKAFLDGYIETATSLICSNINIVEMIPKLVQKAFQEGTSQMLRELRHSLATGNW